MRHLTAREQQIHSQVLAESRGNDALVHILSSKERSENKYEKIDSVGADSDACVAKCQLRSGR